ncbi:MAG TPA: hypothetical protein VFS05_10160 [Gemmatimonadaceae bacterium]|nr:hypothetical protein [Gemmatimonadaceae bacterium]
MSRHLSARTLATATALAALAAFGAPDRAVAQVDTIVITEHASKATKMEQQAEALRSHPRRWYEAARLYVRAAGLRGGSDPRATKDLQQAAHLYFALNELDSASTAMRRAGDAAMARGDVVLAADAYLNAAWVAGRDGDAPAMHDFLDRARALASSPLLTSDQRRSILERAGYPANVAVRTP